MRVNIIGTGSLACLFGAELQTHADVCLIGTWQCQVDILQSQGLCIRYPDGSETTQQIKATSAWQKVSPADLVLILVKSYDTPRAVMWSKRLLTNNGLAITLQNGLGNFEQLCKGVGEKRAALGITYRGATLEKPGILKIGGEGTTYLARSSLIEQRLEQTYQLFTCAGIKTQITDNAEQIVWGKLAVNASINPVTAILQRPNGFLVENPHAQALVCSIAQEVESIARAQGIILAYENIAEHILQVARATANNRSSMLQDIERGSSTEIDSICGEIVRRAQKLAIDAPVNRMLWQLVSAIPNQERSCK